MRLGCVRSQGAKKLKERIINFMRNSLKKTSEFWGAVMPLVFAVAFALMFIKAVYPNSDTFFIIKTGEYIVQHGVVPMENPFVLHEGFGVIIQQWLFDVLIYGFYTVAGDLGVYLYSACIMVVSMVMMYRFFGLYSQNKQLKVLLLAACTMIGCSFMVARPTSISFLLCLSAVMVMETYRQTRKWQALLWLPVISLLLINFHASMWPVMFVLLVPFLFFDSLPKVKELGFKSAMCVYYQQWFGKWKWALLAIFGMFLVGFVNPNGIRGMSYLLLSYSSANTAKLIAELKSPEISSSIGILIILSIILLLGYLLKYKKNADMAKLYMAAGTIFLAMMHNRNMWFLFFGMTPIVLTLCGDVRIKMKTKEYASAVPYAILNGCYVLAAVVLSIFVFNVGDLEVSDSNTTPVAAVEYLDNLDTPKENVVLFTGFNNGAFMEFHDYKVYIDARPELFQEKINGKKDIYTEYLRVYAGAADFEAFLEKYQFTHLIVMDGTAFAGFLQAHGDYVQVVDGNGYSLFEFH